MLILIKLTLFPGHHCPQITHNMESEKNKKFLRITETDVQIFSNTCKTHF